MSRIMNAVSRAEHERPGASTAAVREVADQRTPGHLNAPAAASPRRDEPGAGGAVAPERIAAVETWEQALEVVKRRLAESEEQAARHAADETRYKAQLAAGEQLIARVQQEQQDARQQLEQSQRSAAASAGTKAVCLRQLEALRDCQVLAHACRVTERELDTSTMMVSQATQTQARASAELTHHREREEALRQHIEQLRYQLAKALASTGTVHPS